MCPLFTGSRLAYVVISPERREQDNTLLHYHVSLTTNLVVRSSSGFRFTRAGVGCVQFTIANHRRLCSRSNSGIEITFLTLSDRPRGDEPASSTRFGKPCYWTFQF